ncbi:MAG: hypothetical protein U0941_16065 [Planctomycetaceae bacterium]
MTVPIALKLTSRERVDDSQANPDASPAGGDQPRSAGRKPDAIITLANIRVSGWLSPDKGWSYVASRSYRDQAGNIKFSELHLYGRDLLPLATALQAMVQNMMTVHVERQHTESAD